MVFLEAMTRLFLPRRSAGIFDVTAVVKRRPILLLAQGWRASATAAALERDPHTIGRWAAAFGEGGPRALIFEQTGGSPPPLARRSGRS